jgi:hypothetical protein
VKQRRSNYKKADVDYKTGPAVIVFDSAKQSPASLSAYVVSSGYHVKEVRRSGKQQQVATDATLLGIPQNLSSPVHSAKRYKSHK